jgi:hypothetical protein
MKEESINQTPAIFAIIVVVSLFATTLIAASQNASAAPILQNNLYNLHSSRQYVAVFAKDALMIRS